MSKADGIAGPKYSLKPEGEGWRKELAKRQEKFKNKDVPSIFEEIQDNVYTRALNGQTWKQICLFYGVDTTEFLMFHRSWASGNADLQDRIQQHTLDFGFETNQIIAKIWMGKAFANLSESPQVTYEGQDDDITINFKIIRKEPSDTSTGEESDTASSTKNLSSR